MLPSPSLARLRTRVAPFVSALIVAVFGSITYASVRRENETGRLVDHTHRVIELNHEVLARMVDAETGERGFIITGDSAYLAPYRGSAADVRQNLERLRQLTRDNPPQQARLDSVGPLIARRLDLLEARIGVRQRFGSDSARVAIMRAGGGKALMDSVRVMLAAVDAAELRLLDARDANRARRERTVVWVLAVGTLVACAFALFLDLVLSRAAATQTRLAQQLDVRAKALEAANSQLQDQAEALQSQTEEMEALNEELQTSNEQLEQRSMEAEEANRIKSRFLASITHDLRTPLNAISGYVSVLELGIRGPVTSEQSDDLQRIKRSSNHLLSLIDKLLTFSKVEARRLEIRFEDVPVHDVLAGIDPLVRPQVSAKHLELARDDCDAALSVRADREKLDQILVNLLSNAIKFTAPGGSIQVGCAADDDSVRLHVRDTGCGIPADQLEMVFQPFVQVGDQSGHGFGLGLPISRELARAMNGDLTVTSKLGDGSTFTLTLARAERDDHGVA